MVVTPISDGRQVLAEQHAWFDEATAGGTCELAVIAGSHGFGLSSPTSDIDIHGLWSADPMNFLGLHPDRLQRSAVRNGPDVPDMTFHELGKFCELALNANPNVLETLASPLVVEATPFGHLLRDNLWRFLSVRVVASHLGYAREQFVRLSDRRGTFASDLAKRTEKHALHMFRLLEQGERTITTGEFTIECPDPERLRDLSRLPFDQMGAHAVTELARIEALPTSNLPDEPQYAWVNEAVREHRRGVLCEGD